MGRPHPPRTPIERDIVEAEASRERVRGEEPGASRSRCFAARNVLGPDVRTSHIDLFSLPAVPMILGFDPRYQFVHEDDVVNALKHVRAVRAPRRLQRGRRRRAGAQRGGGPARQALRADPAAVGHRPGRVGAAARRPADPARDAEPDALRSRGRQPAVKAAGFEYVYTSREAVLKLGEHLRLHPLMRAGQEPYRYEQEVEEFLRWSPHVQGSGAKTAPLSREQVVELRRLLGRAGARAHSRRSTVHSAEAAPRRRSGRPLRRPRVGGGHLPARLARDERPEGAAGLRGAARRARKRHLRDPFGPYAREEA